MRAVASVALTFEREKESGSLLHFIGGKISMKEALCRCDISFDGGAGIPGWNDASETLNVTLELVRGDYTEEQIEKLWGGKSAKGHGRSGANRAGTAEVTHRPSMVSFHERMNEI